LNNEKPWGWGPAALRGVLRGRRINGPVPFRIGREEPLFRAKCEPLESQLTVMSQKTELRSGRGSFDHESLELFDSFERREKLSRLVATPAIIAPERGYPSL
jgi:hypothetical protein